MAMIDYGAIVIKNGKMINENEFFQNMNKAVGWNDDNVEYVYPKNGEVYKNACLCGNEFAYIGDKDFTIGFYKNYCRISWEGNTDYLASHLWNNKSIRPTFKGITFHIKELCDRVNICELNYKDDHYFVIFGYGIDSNLKIWNEIKYRYLGKKRAKRVDAVLRRYGINISK